MMKGITKAKKPTAAKSKNAKGQPSLDHFISSRDYTGALALLEFRLKCQDGDTKELLMWIGYCSFHLGSFKRAEDAYKVCVAPIFLCGHGFCLTSRTGRATRTS